MSEPLTPEEVRAKVIAELMALPGPKPLKPIPPDVKAEALAEVASEEEWQQQLDELMRTGNPPLEPLLEELDRMVEDGR